MKWVAWRQSRLELIIGVVLLVVFAALLVPVGLEKHAIFRNLGLANMSSSAPAYNYLAQQFFDSYGWLNGVADFPPFAPLIVGALLAVPIVLEFEQRTYRLAWTQSVTRGRWLVTKLGIAFILGIVFSALLSVLMAWWLGPSERLTSPFNYFEQHGIVPVAYAVFAFTAALAIGTLSRRTAVAVIVAVFVSVALVSAVHTGLRPDYMTPVEQKTTVTLLPPGGSSTDNGPIGHLAPDGAWVVGQYLIDASGNRLNSTAALTAGATFTQVVEYQPADRYWAFQGIESSMFLGMSAVLLGTTVWVVKRRMR